MPVIAVCIGAIGSGKTTLLRKLQDTTDEESEPLPTVGINHFNAAVSQSQDQLPERDSISRCFSVFASAFKKEAHKQTLTIREFGGALAPAWTNYLTGIFDNKEETVGIIYVIDVSTTAKISEVGVHLIDIVEFIERQKTETKVLIVFSKVDLVERSCKDRILCEARSLLRLSYLTSWCKYCQIDQVDYSCITEQGITTIRNWCNSLYYP